MGINAEEMLAEASRQRHDLLNHLQVISGWLQLGRNDRALAYIQTLCDKLENERVWQTRLPRELVARLLDIQRKFSKEHLQIDVRLYVPEHTDSNLLADRVESALSELLRLLSAEWAASLDEGRIVLSNEPEDSEHCFIEADGVVLWRSRERT